MKIRMSIRWFFVVLAAFYQGLEIYMVQRMASLKQDFALHKIIKLRQRRIFTRSNKVRLRYVAGCACALSALVLTAVTLPSSGSTALRWDSNVVASFYTEPTQSAEDVILSEVAKDVLKSHISDGIRRASEAMQKPQPPLQKELEIGSGDTVSGVLEAAGLTRSDAYFAVQAMSEHYDPRKIKPGQVIQVNYKRVGYDQVELKDLSVKIDPVQEVVISKNGEESFAAELHEKELVKRTYAFKTQIESSLYGSAAKAGIPSQIIAEMIRVYSWTVDFQRDIRQGDTVEVLYEAMETEDGSFARYGNVVFANLGAGGKERPIYRFEMKDGRVDYFGPEGMSMRKTLMKTPVDGARVSSGFGNRRHPVLGYDRMHKGVDFAAPTGTPIYAAGDGTIEFIGRNGGYGNYIRIRHNSTLKTAYAHMHNYARGMTKGKRVRQGEVIGYIGSTGRSTGPHLHYEVHVNGAQVNPNSVKLPTGEELKGEELQRFKGIMANIRQQYVSLSGGAKYAAGQPVKNSVQ
jgi:murein DD-endopeptidase MepM/ murein hydrolase activator NlpD